MGFYVDLKYKLNIVFLSTGKSSVPNSKHKTWAVKKKKKIIFNRLRLLLSA